MIKFIFWMIFITVVFIANSRLFACTTAIISGSHTPDGRPLLFKHRDSGHFQNRMVYLDDGKFSYIGVVNSEDSLNNEIWMGCNSAGFAIMNSQSYNLIEKDTVELKDREGFVMKAALQNCETLLDFEKMIETMPKPLGVEANFGVIDAYGGAAYYETDNYSFVKYDVNDPIIAPHGYIIRTNYSFTKNQNNGYGYIRYSNAENLLEEAMAANELNSKFLLQKVSRSLQHGLTKEDLTKTALENSASAKFVFFEDFIPRYTSVSSMAVKGINKVLPEQTPTIWTILGFPLCSVAIPTWFNDTAELPTVLKGNKDRIAPLCDQALTLKDKCFPIKRGSGKKYLNLSGLMNNTGTGILQQIIPLENEIIKKTESLENKWKNSRFNSEDVYEFYKWIDSNVINTLNIIERNQ